MVSLEVLAGRPLQLQTPLMVEDEGGGGGGGGGDVTTTDAEQQAGVQPCLWSGLRGAHRGAHPRGAARVETGSVTTALAASHKTERL